MKQEKVGSLEGEDGEGGGRDVQVEGDMHKTMANSWRCLVETNTTVRQLSFN